MLRKIVVLSILTSIAAISTSPFDAVSSSASPDTEEVKNAFAASPIHIFSETAEKVEAEEKILFDISNGHSTDHMRAGHRLDGLYSIPPERNYLLDEPPNA